jgi:probable F420-dependent oxidoreductase
MSPPPLIGVLLPTRDRLAAGEASVGPLLELARDAEALGLDSVWVGDSPLARPRADALMMLAAVAAQTERVVLGTAVLLPALRHPIVLAHELATLDRIAGGRLIVGAGGGFSYPITEAQFEAIGVPFRTRVSRLEECIEAMRLLWRDDAVSFHGRHYAFEDVSLAPKPQQAGGPSIWLAGGGGPALRRVGRIGDGWLPYPPTAEAYAADWSVIRKAAREEGRPGAVVPAMYATVCVDEEPERAAETLRASIERYYEVPLEVIQAIQALFAGTPEQCAVWLGEYVEAGARHIVVRFAVGDHAAALEGFASSVLPLMRDSATARPVVGVIDR